MKSDLAADPAVHKQVVDEAAPTGGVGPRRMGSDSAMPQVVAIVLGLRVALGVVGWATLKLIRPTQVGGDFLNLQLSDRSPLWPFVGPWERWDALWYHHIAAYGYRSGSSDAAFFPLYPSLIRLVSSVVGSYVLSGLLISTIAFAVGLTLLHRLVRRDFDPAVADRTILYLALAPTAFFFLAPFTEALFLALTVAVFVAMRQRSWVAAGLLGALAALCRANGILLMAPLVVAWVSDVRQRRQSGQRWLVPAHAALLLPAVALTGWFVYTATILHVRGGFLGAEAPWAQHIVAPWVTLQDSWRTVLSGSHPEEAFNLGAVMFLMISFVIMWRRLPWEYIAYTAVLIPIVICREGFLSPLMSAGRYVVVMFPLFVLLGIAGNREWLDRAVTVGFPPLMTLLFIFYVRYGFAG